MMMTCRACGFRYDDVDRSTVCPHERLPPAGLVIRASSTEDAFEMRRDRDLARGRPPENEIAYVVLGIDRRTRQALAVSVFSEPSPTVSTNVFLVVVAEYRAETYEAAKAKAERHIALSPDLAWIRTADQALPTDGRPA